MQPIKCVCVSESQSTAYQLKLLFFWDTAIILLQLQKESPHTSTNTHIHAAERQLLGTEGDTVAGSQGFSGFAAIVTTLFKQTHNTKQAKLISPAETLTNTDKADK